MTEDTKAGGEGSQEEEKESEEDEHEDVITDMEDAATRIQAGMRGLAHRMTLKSEKLADSQPGYCHTAIQHKLFGLKMYWQFTYTHSNNNIIIR